MEYANKISDKKGRRVTKNKFFIKQKRGGADESEELFIVQCQ